MLRQYEVPAAIAPGRECFLKRSFLFSLGTIYPHLSEFFRALEQAAPAAGLFLVVCSTDSQTGKRLRSKFRRAVCVEAIRYWVRLDSEPELDKSADGFGAAGLVVLR